MREICLIHECLVEKFESADKADVVGIAFSEDEVVLESAFYILLFFLLSQSLMVLWSVVVLLASPLG